MTSPSISNNKPLTLVWDMPVRICHWLMVILVVAQWITAELLDDAMQWHAWFGYTLLGVVLFRLAWGFLGTRYAKFGQFLASPTTCFDYIKRTVSGNAPVYTGHNPLGGWMALLLLLLLLAQSVSGLFMTDDIFFYGPYYYAVESETQKLMSSIHNTSFEILQYAILLHVVAALIYVFVKKQPLIVAMFTGKKRTRSPGIMRSRWRLAIIIVLVVSGLLYLLINVWAPIPDDIWSY